MPLKIFSSEVPADDFFDESVESRSNDGVSDSSNDSRDEDKDEDTDDKFVKLDKTSSSAFKSGGM